MHRLTTVIYLLNILHAALCRLNATLDWSFAMAEHTNPSPTDKPEEPRWFFGDGVALVYHYDAQGNPLPDDDSDRALSPDTDCDSPVFLPSSLLPAPTPLSQ